MTGRSTPLLTASASESASVPGSPTPTLPSLVTGRWTPTHPGLEGMGLVGI
jgi:hypothetical protein